MIKKIFLLCLCSLSLTAIAQDAITRSETIERSFDVDENDRLEIENKYGEIIIEEAEGNQVNIKVEITISGGNRKALTDLEDFVNVEIDKNGSFIVARTIWGKNANFFAKSFEGIKNKFDGNRSVEVNYTVECPTYLDLRITNKFGDIFIDRYTGNLDINLSHGDLRSRLIESPREVSVSYGNVFVDEWGSGRVEVLFGELDSKELKNILLFSKKSKIDIRTAENLNINSQNDNFHIEEVSKLTGNSRFTNLRVDRLTSELRLDQDYGEVRIEEVDESFELVQLDMLRSDATLHMDETTSFKFSVSLTNGETFSSVPDLITMKKDEEVGKERQMEGFWKEPHPSRKVIVKGESAVLNIAKR
ncbi:MAG: hypothetical protein MK086_03970 [Flavobacteriales bacterium]|nr:hypothetical protein [Flavobacteriales bacterium]